MSRSKHARFAIPSALSVSIITLAGCPQPTAPGTCVSHFVPPDGATAPASSVHPQVDIAPCAAQRTGIDWMCLTASNCQVTYVGDVNAAQGAPIQNVMCPTIDQCLWGIDASGQPIFGGCPQLDVQPQHCQNDFRFDDVRQSSFTCTADLSGCTLSGGGTGHQFAMVRRLVTGGVDSTACPTPCTEFA